MYPSYTNGQPTCCKLPIPAKDLLIPPFKRVISKKYAWDFIANCNEAPYLYNEHDLYQFYAERPHPSLSQGRIYVKILYSPQIVHHPGFPSKGFEPLIGI